MKNVRYKEAMGNIATYTPGNEEDLSCSSSRYTDPKGYLCITNNSGEIKTTSHLKPTNDMTIVWYVTLRGRELNMKIASETCPIIFKILPSESYKTITSLPNSLPGTLSSIVPFMNIVSVQTVGSSFKNTFPDLSTSTNNISLFAMPPSFSPLSSGISGGKSQFATSARIEHLTKHKSISKNSILKTKLLFDVSSVISSTISGSNRVKSEIYSNTDHTGSIKNEKSTGLFTELSFNIAVSRSSVLHLSKMLNFTPSKATVLPRTTYHVKNPFVGKLLYTT